MLLPCLAVSAAADDSDKMQALWHKYAGGDIAVSGDGQHIAVVSGKVLYLYDQAGQNELWKYTATDPLTRVAISRDGQYVAMAGNIFVYLFDHDGTPQWPSGTNVGSGVNNVAISNDGQYVSFGSSGQLYLFNRNGQLWMRTAPGLGYGMAVVSGDGKYVCGVNYHGLCFYDRDVTAPKWQSQFASRVDQIAISSDGRYTAATSDDKNLYLHYINGDMLWSKNFGDSFKCLAMTPDARYIAACSRNGNLKLYDLKGDMVWGVQLPNWANSVAISDDGNYTVAGTYDQLINVYDRNGSRIWSRLMESPVNRVSMSSDGSYITAATDSEIVFMHNGPPVTPTPAPGAATAGPGPAVTAVPGTVSASPGPTDTTANGTVSPASTPGNGLPVTLLLAVGLGIVLLGAGGGLFLLYRRNKGSQPSRATTGGSGSGPSRMSQQGTGSQPSPAASAGAGGGLFKKFRRGSAPAITINIVNATEDDDVKGSVNVRAGPSATSISGAILLSGKLVRTIDGPDTTPVSLGHMSAGKYELRADCTIRDKSGNDVKYSEVLPFEISEAAPALTACAHPLTSVKDERVKARVTLTNPSAFPAIFESFVLAPGESRDFWFDVNTSVPGQMERKIGFRYKNRAGRVFTTETVIRYTVQETGAGK